MSFFETYTDIGGGGDWISASEKQVLMDEGIPFEITAVADDDANQYGPRFAVFVRVPDPATGDETERKIGFAKAEYDEAGERTAGVPSRDSMLTQLQQYLATDSPEPVLAKLEKVGRSILIRQA